MDTTDTYFNTCVQALSILGLGLTIAKLVNQYLAKRDELKSIEQLSTMRLKSNVGELFKSDAATIWSQAHMLKADAAHQAVVAAAVRLNAALAELNKEENDINRRTECLLQTIAALNEMGIKIQFNIASPEDKAATRPAIIVKGEC